jgi:hypothetical protein
MSNNTNQQFCKSITTLVQRAVLARSQDFLQSHNACLEPLDYHLTVSSVLANQMVLIQIYGKNMILSLKFQYNLKDIRFLASTYLDKPEDQISQIQIIDLMKEFANLTSGYIKATLSSSQLDVLCSLPVSTRGYHQIFSEHKDLNTLIINEGWRLNLEKTQIYVCFSLESPQPELIQNTIINLDIQDNNEEVEFL